MRARPRAELHRGRPAILTPVTLDPRTAADDSDFLDIIAKEPNLPDA